MLPNQIRLHALLQLKQAPSPLAIYTGASGNDNDPCVLDVLLAQPSTVEFVVATCTQHVKANVVHTTYLQQERLVCNPSFVYCNNT